VTFTGSLSSQASEIHMQFKWLKHHFARAETTNKMSVR